MFSSDPYDSGREWLMPGVSILRGGRGPCIVCGHPTGDCTGAQEREAPPPRIQFAPLAKPDREDPMVLVPEDIWKDVQITSMTKTRVLVAAAGTYLPLSKAQEHGIA